MNKKTLLKKTKFILVGCGLLIFSSLSAQTLKHSYTFEDGTVTGNTVTDVAGTALGSPANGTIIGTDYEVKNGYFYNHNSLAVSTSTLGAGSYISFDSTSLALNNYSAITIEAYITTSSDQNSPNKWSCLAYFGGSVAGTKGLMLQPEISGALTKAGYNNTIFATGPEAGANETHHYVAVLTPSTDLVAGSIALYYDGVLKMSTTLAAGSYNTAVSSLATSRSFLGKDGWNDALFTQPIHEFNIYDGVMDAATVQARYNARNTQLATLTVNTGILSPAFSASIYNYGVILPIGITSLTIGATTAISSKTVVGASTYDVSGDYGTIIVKVDSVGAVPYLINWRKDVSVAILTHSYTFTDGTAKDVAGTASGTLSTAAAGDIANGVFTTTAGASYVSGNSQYISLPASSIAINQYPIVTLETFVKTTATPSYFSFFGNQTLNHPGTDFLYMFTGSSNIGCNSNHQPWNGTNTTAIAGTALNDSKVHHVVTVVTNDSIILFQDGVLKGRTFLPATNKLFNVSSKVAYLGRPAYLNDNNYIGAIGEFNIYKGRMAASTVVTRATDYLKNATLSAITLSAGSLEFNSATTTYNVNVPVGTTTITVGATTTKDFATVSGAGIVTLDGLGKGTATLTVTSADGTTTNIYTVNFTNSGITDVVNSRSINWKASIVDNKLKVTGVESFEVYSVQGLKVAQVIANSAGKTVALNQGVYIIKTDKGIQKVIIK